MTPYDGLVYFISSTATGQLLKVLLKLTKGIKEIMKHERNRFSCISAGRTLLVQSYSVTIMFPLEGNVNAGGSISCNKA